VNDASCQINANKNIREIAVSPDGPLIAIGYGFKFEVYNAETMTLLKEVPLGSNTGLSLKFLVKS